MLGRCSEGLCVSCGYGGCCLGHCHGNPPTKCVLAWHSTASSKGCPQPSTHNLCLPAQARLHDKLRHCCGTRSFVCGPTSLRC